MKPAKPIILFLFLVAGQSFVAKGQLAFNWERTDMKDSLWVSGFTSDKLGNSYFLCSKYPAPDSAHDIIMKYNSNGILQWTKKYFYEGYSSNTNSWLNCINVDDGGNIYFVDWKNGTNSFYLVKLDNNGNIIYENWVAYYYQGSYHNLYIDKNDFVHLVIQDYTPTSEINFLQIYCFSPPGNTINHFTVPIFSSENQIMTDNKSNVYLSTDDMVMDSGLYYCYVRKFDSAGDLLWKLRNPYNTYEAFLSWARDSNLIETYNGVDTVNVNGIDTGAIVKINPLYGSILKEVVVPGLGNYFEQTDNEGSLYFTTNISITSPIYVDKYDDNLNLKFSSPTTDSLNPWELVLGKGKSLYVIGNPQYFPSTGFAIYIEKIDSNGNTVDLKNIEYPGLDINEFNACTDTSGNIYIGTRLSSSPDSTLFYEGFYLIKFCSSCAPNISGKVFIDSNKNCIPDSDEKNLSNRLVQMLPDEVYTFTDSSGNYSFNAANGSHTIREILPNRYWSFTCDSVYTITIDSLNQVDSNLNFGNIAIDSINDLAVSVGFPPLVSGFDNWITINYSNIGNTDLSSTVTLKMDSSFTYVMSTDSPTYILGDSVVWNVGLLKSGSNGQINVLCNGSLYDTIGLPFTITARIFPIINDYNPSNNVDSVSDYIRDSYDPNEKIVYPLALRTSTIIIPSVPITYQINFQNTGNDTAQTVMVQDAIDPNLDLSTFVMDAASSPCQLAIVNGRTLQWTFNNILLPDSGHNQAASHGFIKYSISAKPNTTHSDITISNTASVYFDYNLPVNTDTVKFIENGIPIMYTSTSLMVYPNPSGTESIIQYTLPKESDVQLEMFDLFGRRTLQSDLGSQPEGLYRYKLNLQQYSTGIYIIRMRTSTGNYTCKLSVVR